MYDGRNGRSCEGKWKKLASSLHYPAPEERLPFSSVKFALKITGD
ncbi:MAG: hypothetical protein ACI87O_000905 [Planctomycetota bacterium]|jgi:hypothetical protein